MHRWLLIKSDRTELQTVHQPANTCGCPSASGDKSSCGLSRRVYAFMAFCLWSCCYIFRSERHKPVQRKRELWWYPCQAVQDALQYHGTHVRCVSDIRTAGDHRAEVPRPPAASGVRGLRVSSTVGRFRVVCVCSLPGYSFYLLFGYLVRNMQPCGRESCPRHEAINKSGAISPLILNRCDRRWECSIGLPTAGRL